MPQLVMVPDHIVHAWIDSYERTGDFDDGDLTFIVPMEGRLLCERVSPSARNPWATMLVPFGS